MLTWIVLLVAAVAAFLVYRALNKVDVLKDGALDKNDANAVADAVKADVKEILDVNKDGQVNVADAVEAGKKAKAGAKKAAGKVKDAAKKVKKPKLKVAK
jgi:hypothetical protein